MLSVSDAKYIENYKVKVTFNDGTQKIVDLYNVMNNDHREIFQELTDEDKFKDFVVDMDTIIWSNGLDLAPEFLYEIASITPSP